MTDFDEWAKRIRSTSKNFQLPKNLPNITNYNLGLIKSLNSEWQLPFFYVGSALLLPETKRKLTAYESAFGRYLGGGVFSSRVLEWLDSDRKGAPPGDYEPKRGLFGQSKKPQSQVSCEWVAFEYGLVLVAPRNLYGMNWDDVVGVSVIRSQGRDLHIRIDCPIGGGNIPIFGQANAQNIKNLLEICKTVSVPVF